ncbi:MAG: hypothetical protein QW076_03380 [Candidatus Anstonellales archaeon]
MKDLLGLIAIVFGLVSIILGLTYLPYGVEGLMSGKPFVPYVVGFAIFLAFGILLFTVAFFALRES